MTNPHNEQQIQNQISRFRYRAARFFGSNAAWPDDEDVDPSFWGSANDINDSDQIVGYSGTWDYQDHALLWENGYSFELPGQPRDGTSEATAINNHGQIAGYITSGIHRSQAVIWDRGQIIELGTLVDHENSLPTSINDRGQIVGFSRLRGNPDFHSNAAIQRAWEWQDGKIIDLGALPGDRSSSASAINSAGQIVGWSKSHSGDRKAVLWQDGEIIPLETLPGRKLLDLSSAGHIDDCGQILGTVLAGGSYRTVLWDQGKISDITPPLGEVKQRFMRRGSVRKIGDPGQNAMIWHNGAWIELGNLSGDIQGSASAINAKGTIVGRSKAENGDSRAVLWQDDQVIDLSSFPKGS